MRTTDVTRRNPDRTRERLLEAGFARDPQSRLPAGRARRHRRTRRRHQGRALPPLPRQARPGLRGAGRGDRPVPPICGGSTRSATPDPLTAIAGTMREAFKTDFEHGCPLNNLSQEMSRADEGFHQRIAALYRRWEGRRGGSRLPDSSAASSIQPSTSDDAATFVVASIEGAYSCQGPARIAPRSWRAWLASRDFSKASEPGSRAHECLGTAQPS